MFTKIALVLLCLAPWCPAQEILTLKSGTTENLRGLHSLHTGVVWASAYRRGLTFPTPGVDCAPVEVRY